MHETATERRLLTWANVEPRDGVSPPPPPSLLSVHCTRHSYQRRTSALGCGHCWRLLPMALHVVNQRHPAQVSFAWVVLVMGQRCRCQHSPPAHRGRLDPAAWSPEARHCTHTNALTTTPLASGQRCPAPLTSVTSSSVNRVSMDATAFASRLSFSSLGLLSAVGESTTAGRAAPTKVVVFTCTSLKPGLSMFTIRGRGFVGCFTTTFRDALTRSGTYNAHEHTCRRHRHDCGGTISGDAKPVSHCRCARTRPVLMVQRTPTRHRAPLQMHSRPIPRVYSAMHHTGYKTPHRNTSTQQQCCLHCPLITRTLLLFQPAGGATRYEHGPVINNDNGGEYQSAKAHNRAWGTDSPGDSVP